MARSLTAILAAPLWNSILWQQSCRCLSGSKSQYKIQFLNNAKNNANKLLLAAREADSFEAAVKLFKQVKTLAIPIRDEHFWKHIQSQTNKESLLDVIKTMRSEFSIESPSKKALQEYIVPKLAEWMEPDALMVTLQYDIGCKSSAAATIAVYHYISTSRWDAALRIAKNYRVFYNAKAYERKMIDALNATRNAEAFVEFARILMDSDNRVQRPTDKQPDGRVEGTKCIFGDLLYEVAAHSADMALFKTILTTAVSHGLSITDPKRIRIEHLLQTKTDADSFVDLSTLLKLLANGLLLPSQMPNKSKNNPKEVERVRMLLESSPESLTTANYHTLLEVFFKEKKKEDFVALAKRLEVDGRHHLSDGVYQKWMTLELGDIDETMRIVKKMANERPEIVFQRPVEKICNVISELLAADRIDDAITFLSVHRKGPDDTVNYAQKILLHNMCKTLAERGKQHELQRCIDILLTKNFVPVSRQFLGPLVLVHLVNNDLKGAVETFTRLVKQYRVTPWKRPLLCELIRNDCVNELEQVIDMSKELYGEMDALMDLSLAFLETGRDSLAKDILVSLPGRIRSDVFVKSCQHYRKYGRTDFLEKLLKITASMQQLDRSCIFDALLLSYCQKEQTDAIFTLWQRRISDGLPKSDIFLKRIAGYVHQKGITVPIVLPQSEQDAFQLMLDVVKSQHDSKINR